MNQQNVERLNNDSVQQQRVEPSQSQASYQNPNQGNVVVENNGDNDNDDDNQKITLCADCEVNIDDPNCPQTCEVTGKSHF